MPLSFLKAADMAKSPALADVDPNSMPIPPQSGFWGIKTKQSTRRERRQTVHIVQRPLTTETAAYPAGAATSASMTTPRKPLVSVPSSRPSTRSLYERRHVDGTLMPLTVSGTRSTSSESKYHHNRSREASDLPIPTEQIPSVHQLRSGSGMTLHTNTSALRRYTDYNEDGSPRRPEFAKAGRLDVKDDAATTTPLFSRSTVRAVMDDPVARQHLCDYMRKQGGAENLDFLEKVEEYTKALQNVTALVASLSTSFTSVAAATPLHLPLQLSKSLNADIKHVSSSIIPGLHTLFGQASAHVEDRIVRDVYPAFVKHQLALRMKATLGAPPNNNNDHAPFSFSGLGSAFCLVDPYRPDNSVVYASDAFASVMGYASANDVPRSGRLLKIPKLGDNGTFSEGIMLTHRRPNNEPFWSHVSVCPIASLGGRVRFLLVSLVDLSTAVQTRADVLRALAVENPAARGASRNSTISCANTENSTSTTSTAGGMSSIFSSPMDESTTPASSSAPSPEPSFRARSRMGWKTNKPSSSTKPLFHMFSRKRNTEAASGGATGDCTDAPATVPCPVDTTLPCRVENPEVVHRPFPDGLPVYAPFILLQFVPGPHPNEELQPPSFPRPSSRRSIQTGSKSPLRASFANPSRLKVAFASKPVLELLGIHTAAQDAVMYQDVFSVLSGLANSPSITSAFRSTVYERVAASASASLELAIPDHSVSAIASSSEGDLGKLAVPPGIRTDDLEAGMGRRSRRLSELVLDPPKLETKGSGSVGRPSTGWRPRSSKIQWQSSSPERPTTGDWNGQGAGNVRKLMSHWAPLKDADGSVAWVVLVLSPAI